MLVKKIADTSGLVITTVLNAKVKNKIADTSSLASTTVLNIKISEVENKTPDRSRYITNKEFTKLTAENLTAGLTQCTLVSKTDF